MKSVIALATFILFASMTGCSKHKISETPLPFYLDRDLGPHWVQPGSGEWTNLHAIKAFQLVDQNGQPFTEKNLTGRIAVAHFFFTRCAGICPKTIRNLKKVASDFQNDEGVLFVSYSVTPEIDTPEVLRSYAAEHSLPIGHWRLLTGERKQIYKLAREDFFADSEAEASSERSERPAEDLGKTGPRGDDFLHSENVYLLDSKRRIRGLYKGTFEPEMIRLAEDIAALKKESY